MIAETATEPQGGIDAMKASSSRRHSELEALRTAEPMIRLRNIEKRCRTSPGFRHVLRGINFDIARGEFVSILGPSGAGKSALLKVLGMYDHVWEGEFFFCGFPVHRFGPKERSTLNTCLVGFVFQRFHLLDDLTVAGNLEVQLLNRITPKSNRQSVVADTLDRFDIAGKKDHYPSQLSSDQRQLVAIARAIIAKPKLILADEPTANLRSGQSGEIMRLFKEMNQEGVTIVQATRSETNAAYGNRIVRLKDGWMET